MRKLQYLEGFYDAARLTQNSKTTFLMMQM